MRGLARSAECSCGAGRMGGSALKEVDRDSRSTAPDINPVLSNLYQPVDEVVVQPGRWSKPLLKTIRAGTALFATRTMRMAPSAAPSRIGNRTRTHQPRA